MTGNRGAADDGPSRSRPALVRWVERCELTVGAALIFVIFILILVQATQRHLPVDGWVWTGELARFGLVWLTFSLLGYLLGRDEHITLKVVDFVARGWVLRVVWIIANLVVAAITVAFIFEAYELLFHSPPQTTPALGIPVSLTYVIPMAGLILAAVRAVANAFLAGPPNPDTLPTESADLEEPNR